MPTLPDARLDNPVLNDSFDFSRYPTFKTRNANPSTKPRELRHRTRGRTELFPYSNRGSPSRVQLSRNVSEPQLVSSTNYMRESWFTGFASARTVGDIANLSTDDDIFTVIPSSQSTIVTCETLDSSSFCEVDVGQPPKTPLPIWEDSDEITGPSDEGASFYSMDSADQDAHPLLLSMPIIPQIKLERKATVRQPDPVPPLDATRNQCFLSPRIRDLRTPARMSSRRYGRILERPSPEAVACDATPDKSDARDNSEATRRPETELTLMRSTSEPLSNSPCPSNDDDETLDSPHSDVLLSMIDEAGSVPWSCSDRQESAEDELPKAQSAPPKHLKCGHQRSSLGHSISLNSIVHAVAEGYATLDLLLRKPKPKATTKPTTREGINAHDPTSRWVPKQGQIVIKVFVPSTDDIWMFRVPQDIGLTDFTSKVMRKLGFTASFSGSVWDEPRYYFRTDDRFKSWVKGRVRFGRNLPIVAHVLPPLPFVKLSVDWDGCEVWYYA